MDWLCLYSVGQIDLRRIYWLQIKHCIISHMADDHLHPQLPNPVLTRSNKRQMQPWRSQVDLLHHNQCAHSQALQSDHLQTASRCAAVPQMAVETLHVTQLHSSKMLWCDMLQIMVKKNAFFDLIICPAGCTEQM